MPTTKYKLRLLGDGFQLCDLEEVGLSDCTYGCKVMRCNVCGQTRVVHLGVYGCQDTVAEQICPAPPAAPVKHKVDSYPCIGTGRQRLGTHKHQCTCRWCSVEHSGEVADCAWTGTPCPDSNED